MLVALLTAVPLGVAAAVWRDRWPDHFSRLASVIGVAMPVFWLGLIFIYCFFYLLHWAPPPLRPDRPDPRRPAPITGLYTVHALLTGNWPSPSARPPAPSSCPSPSSPSPSMAPLARITRSGMIEALDADYTRAARALGLSERSVILRHALRNALLPLLTMTAIVYGYLLGGVVLVDNIFAWPGLGWYVFNAITSSDYPAVQGFILYATTVYVLIFLLVDVLYVVFDPRVRLAR